MSEIFRAHTGRRKRRITAGEVESFAKRRTGTQAQRDAAMKMYEPPVSWRCSTCAMDVHVFRCPLCGEHMPAIPDA